jgi:hypothetical protein
MATRVTIVHSTIGKYNPGFGALGAFQDIIMVFLGELWEGICGVCTGSHCSSRPGFSISICLACGDFLGGVDL